MFKTSAIIKNIGAISIENIVRILLGFGVSVLVARSLGPDQYGKLSYVLSFVLVFSPLFFGGIDEVVVTSFVESKYDKRSVLGTSAIYRAFSGAIGFILSGAIIVIIGSTDTLLIITVVAYSAFNLLHCFDGIKNLYQAEVNIAPLARWRTLSLFASSGVKLLLVYYNCSWNYFVAVSCLEVALFAGGYLYIYSRRRDRVKWTFEIPFLKHLLKLSWPILIAGLLNSLLNKTDQILLATMLDTEKLGQYAISAKLIELVMFLPMAIIASFFPKIIHAKKESDQSYLNSVRILYGLMFWLSLSFSIFMGLFGGTIVNILYGRAYEDAALIARFHACVTLITFFTLARVNVFVAEAKTMLLLLVVFFSYILNLCFNLWLIPIFGVCAPVISTIASITLGELICAFFQKDLKKSLHLYLQGICYLPRSIIKKIYS